MSTEAVVLESSRAIAEPTQPAPTMITSYEPSGFAAGLRERERGHVPHDLSQLPSSMLNSLAQSSMSTQSPPT